MRLLLDAHISGRVVASRLRSQGHDVFALDEHRELEGIGDAEVLMLAAQQQRILITFNLRDFLPLVRQWAEEGRSHAGCVLLARIAQSDFGGILGRLEAAFRERPEQQTWIDLTLIISSASPRR